VIFGLLGVVEVSCPEPTARHIHHACGVLDLRFMVTSRLPPDFQAIYSRPEPTMCRRGHRGGVWQRPRSRWRGIGRVVPPIDDGCEVPWINSSDKSLGAAVAGE
jgi:hypothetical protein